MICFFFFFTDPYQTLGPISSRLANPGKNLHHHKLYRGDTNEAFTLSALATWEKKQARAGTHALTFQNGVKHQATPCCVSRIASRLHWDKKSGFPHTKNDCLPCCFLTEGQALTSSKNRTGKQSPYKLPDPSAHRPVGRFLSRCQSLLQATQWKGHIWWDVRNVL